MNRANMRVWRSSRIARKKHTHTSTCMCTLMYCNHTQIVNTAEIRLEVNISDVWSYFLSICFNSVCAGGTRECKLLVGYENATV